MFGLLILAEGISSGKCLRLNLASSDLAESKGYSIGFLLSSEKFERLACDPGVYTEPKLFLVGLPAIGKASGFMYRSCEEFLLTLVLLSITDAEFFKVGFSRPINNPGSLPVITVLFSFLS